MELGQLQEEEVLARVTIMNKCEPQNCVTAAALECVVSKN